MPRRKRSRSSSSYSTNPDEEGTVRIKKGDTIRDERYKVLGHSGKGTFGTVLEVFDYKHSEKIALKVVRSVKRYLEAAYVEVDILEKIRKSDREQVSKCVRLLGAFTTRIKNQKHVCIAFEKLGKSVYEFLRSNKYRGFTVNNVATIGYQVVHAVAFCHTIKLTHTDLKPENILLVDDTYDTVAHPKHGQKYMIPRKLSVRLIDFGGATFEDDHHSHMINTRQYRAPEVILGLGWDEKSDIWSIGCILAELFTGELLFGTHEDIEHIALMQRILQKEMPVWMVKKALRNSKPSDSKKRKKKKRKGRSPSPVPISEIFRDETFNLAWPENASSTKSENVVKNAKILEDLIGCEPLTRCIRKCLVYDPQERISAAELKEDPLFKDAYFLDKNGDI